ncbi:MAG: nucleotide exchange factor GrpE [Planctomycetota bacterium]|jgi:molecular chaperone GrpE
MSEKKEKKIKVKKTDQTQELQSELEALKQEKDELFAKLQRVSADYANFQKRVPKQIADSIALEKETIIKSLLPAFDNFDHTLDKAKHAENIEDVIKGVEIIYGQMLDILKSFGVEQINALGENFNPTVHQAMMQRSDPDKEEGMILEEFQKGYRLNGRVIRPNKVVVNKQATEDEKEHIQPETDAKEPAEEQGE